MFKTETTVAVRFGCSFLPNPESLTTSKLTDFSVFQRMKNISDNISSSKLWLLIMLIYCLKRSYENILGKLMP